ncbi:MAG: oligosaccharide flippase family protein, partial [Phycisphaerales bacterium]|nr:oligosaccharide flippase family protein [Phycisphaerales bacterium]
AANFVNYLARNLDNILIGKVCGDAALGVYDKAYQLLLLPLRQFNAPIAAVIIPVLSRLQDKKEEFRRAYRTAVGLLAAAGMPVVTLSFVAAPEVVRIFLGPRWDAVVPIFQWLAPAAFVGTTNGAIGWVCISLGRVRRQLAWTLISTPFILAAFVIGVLYKDPVVVAAAFSGVQLLLRWPGLLYCFQGTFIGTRDVVAAVWRPLVASLGAGAGAYALRLVPWSPMHTTLGMFIAMTLSVAALYAAIWLAIPGGRRRLDDVLSLAATILPRRKKPDASNATTSE